jgi:predicted alpha-1,2-mannosidase
MGSATEPTSKSPGAAIDYAALVEPRLGTGSTRWIHFASACRPFGMVNLSPDTHPAGDWGSGYSIDHTTVAGFSHVHDWQIAGLLVMPVVGAIDSRLGGAGREGFASPFSHEREIVKPGDHRLKLDRYGIEVELTSTLRVGFHRYRFPTGADASVLVDLAGTLGPSEMGEALLRKTGPRTFEGHVVNKPTMRRPKPVTVYFAITLSQDATLLSFQGDDVRGKVNAIEGELLRAQLLLGAMSQPLVMAVAISYTSIDAAWENMHAEAEPFRYDFDAVRSDAREEWNRWLSRIEVTGGTDVQRGRFYTDLYFALLGRRTCSDHSGSYIDNTGPAPKVRQIPLDESNRPRYRHFNSDAFWGAQWSITPLWSIAYPEMVEQFCHCFMDYCRNGGLIPRGPSGGNYTFVMTSAQTTPLYVSAIHNRIYRPTDPSEVYQALRKNHFPGGLMSKCGYEHTTCRGGGIEDYISLGYIPEDLPAVGLHNNGAAQTLEHAYNDWALAQLAQSLGKTDDAALFTQRSRNYRNLFDPSIGFMRPRKRGGAWLEPYDPYGQTGWTEANGWSYTFYAAHDVPGLATCFGSAEALCDRLEEGFKLSEPNRFATPPKQKDFHNPFNFGNEPALALAHLFHEMGKPQRTQYWLKRIVGALRSGNSPHDGYGGDEDQGIMGAWNVLVAIGLFAVDGGCTATPRYQITGPFFDSIRIRLHPKYAKGQELRITASRPQQGDAFISSAHLNGKPLQDLYLTHAQLQAGGELMLS